MKRGFGVGNKKGISDVITSVLIIILVIAAIGILWAALKPTIQKGAESTEQAGCFQINLEAVSCVKNSGNTANVTYKLASGDLEVTGVKMVLGKADGSSTSVDADAIAVLATAAKNNIDFGGVPKQFSAAAIIKSSSGKPITCPASQPVQCA